METWLIQIGNQWLRVDSDSAYNALIKAQEAGYSGGTLRGQISNPALPEFADNQYQQAYLAASNDPKNIFRVRNNGEVLDGSGNIVKAAPGPDTSGDFDRSSPPSGGFDDVSAQTDDIERFEFGPAFERAFRRADINIGGGGGLEGAVARHSFNPLEARFFGQEALRAAPGEGEDPRSTNVSFENFIANQRANNSLLGAGSAQASRDLLNRAQTFKTFAEGTLPSELAGGFLNPATSSEGSRLANVALDAGRQRFGSLSRFLPGAQDLSQSFLAQDSPRQGTFADFLNKRIFGFGNQG